MIDKFKTKPFKRKIQRGVSIALSSIAILSGTSYAYMLGDFWPLLVVGFLLFISYGLWITSSCSLEIGTGGIILQIGGRRTFLAWSDLGEFSPGNGIERHKVEFTLRGEKPLASIYKGAANLKLHTPRYLPDTFGMSAKELAALLNARLKEYAKPDAFKQNG